MTSFEKRISQAPRREVPEEWRREVLSGARAVKIGREVPPWEGRLVASVTSWMWPHPYAWGGLAALWLIILMLNFSGPRGESLYAVAPAGVRDVEVSSEFYAGYVRWWKMLASAELEPPQPSEVERRKL